MAHATPCIARICAANLCYGPGGNSVGKRGGAINGRALGDEPARLSCGADRARKIPSAINHHPGHIDDRAGRPVMGEPQIARFQDRYGAQHDRPVACRDPRGTYAGNGERQAFPLFEDGERRGILDAPSATQS